jgi:hypothetical protein
MISGVLTLKLLIKSGLRTKHKNSHLAGKNTLAYVFKTLN